MTCACVHVSVLVVQVKRPVWQIFVRLALQDEIISSTLDSRKGTYMKISPWSKCARSFHTFVL